MASVVVAVGTVLAVLGSWAVYFGYTIVQVERGWATMIAGAAVLSGGVITAALGLVLRRLTAIQAALRPRPTIRPRAARVESEEPAPQLEFALVPPASPHVDSMAEPVLSPPAPPTADLPQETHVAYRDELHPTPAASTASVPVAADSVDDAWRAVHAELQRTDWSTLAHTPDATPEPPLAESIVPHEPARTFEASHEPIEADVSPPYAAEPIARTAHPSQTFAPEPATRAPAAAAVPPHAGAPQSDDDYGDLLGRSKAEPAPDRLHTEAPAPDAAEHPADAPHASSVPHVIGKYEADGTTYTMFSDGSIEAHSPEGTYRFGSMAELKAFIEQTS